jgi:glycine cleavage system H protein
VNTPSHLKYTADHEWIEIKGSVARLGITDYAQDALGDIVFIQLPNVGDQIAAHESFTEIESTKSVSDVYSPVTGPVSVVNEALVATPELLNSDPYGAGWICEISIESVDEAALMTAEAYSALIGA